MFCWYDVLRGCLGKVVTFLGRHHTESVQFQHVVDFLESGCVEFFLVRIRQLIIHHTTLVFRSGCHPERLCLAMEHSHSFDCLKRSSSLVPSRRRHSRARLPVPSNQTRFQREELSNNCWLTPTATKEVSLLSLLSLHPPLPLVSSPSPLPLVSSAAAS